ncbi:hypothetical protein BOX15_Mlig004476g2, partial [Macrostomum lignano]
QFRSALGYFHSSILQQQKVKKQYKFLAIMTAHDELQKIVVEFVVVERPLNTKRPDQASGHKVPHEGCVVTTADGQKYLIEKGVAPDHMEELHRIGGEKGSRIVKIGKGLPSNFRVVKPVTIKNTDVTLMQLLEASGKDYNWLCSNCWNSTESMQSVLTGQVQLPWQFNAGVGAGIIGVFAMVLFVLGRFFSRGAATTN